MVLEDERYNHLHHEAVDLLNVSTDSRLRYDSGEEWVNVPNAIMEMREYEREQARKELQVQSIKAIMKSFNVDAEEAMRALEIPEGERAYYRDELAKATVGVS